MRTPQVRAGEKAVLQAAKREAVLLVLDLGSSSSGGEEGIEDVMQQADGTKSCRSGQEKGNEGGGDFGEGEDEDEDEEDQDMDEEDEEESPGIKAELLEQLLQARQSKEQQGKRIAEPRAGQQSQGAGHGRKR